MKASDLRQSILQAAVQGRLVPQDSKDEPASELLKRIKLEKKQLILDGKIKKEKHLPPINENEAPYDLPGGWVWCRLGLIAELITSGSRDWSKYYSKDGAVFLRMGNLSRNSYDLRLDSIQHVCPPRNSEGSRTRLEPFDILVSITGDVGSLGRIPEGFGEAYINQHTGLVRMMPVLKDRYIPFAFLSPFCKEQFDAPQRGIKNSFRLTDLSYMLIPLPPLAEQHRIVSKVDELMSMCDELEAAEKELDVLEDHFAEYLPKSILQAAVQGKLAEQDNRDEPASELLKRIQKEKARLAKKGKIKNSKSLPPLTKDDIPYDLPDGWVWCRLGDVGTFIRGNGIKRSDVCSSGVSCIRYGEIYTTYNIFTDKAVSFVDENVALKSVSLEYGDVLMTLTGENKEEIGKTVAFLGKDETVIGGDLATFTGHHQDPMYLSYFMNSPFALFQKASVGTGNIIVHISCDKLSMIPLPLPPLAEQHRIVAKVDELLALCSELTVARMSIAKADNTKVIPFPQQPVEDEYEDICMVARGDGTGLISEKLRQAIDDWDDEDE